MNQPLTIYRDHARAEWVDYNRHLRDAYYLLLFSYAVDALIDHIGLDEVERERSQRSLYTLEVHLNYLAEVKEGTPLRVDVQLLGHDAKRLHVYLGLHRGEEPEPVAVSEQMLMSVDMAQKRSAPFAPVVLERIAQIAAAHAELPKPPYVGRVMALPPARTVPA
jgi:acyl-CoA thioester hydrolase